jgi:hypothetical protein
VNVADYLLNVCEGISPGFRILLISLLAVSLLSLMSCCGKPPVTIDFQRPQIPPALLIPQYRLRLLASDLCDDQPEYTNYVIESFNQCAANYNSLIDMVK